MYSQDELDRLIEAMRANGVTSLELEAQDQSLQLDLAATYSSPAAPAAAPAVQDVAAKSPCMGRFIARGDDDGLSALDLGSSVTTGETLGYIATGLLRALILAPTTGRLSEALPATGTIFGFGDKIISMEKNS